MALCIAAEAATCCVCSGQTVSVPLEFSAVLERNATNGASIQTGQLVCRYDFDRVASLDTKAKLLSSFESMEKGILQDSTLTDAQRLERLSQVDRQMRRAESGDFSAIERHESLNRIVTFDVNKGMYKQADEPLDPTMLIRSKPPMESLDRHAAPADRFRTIILSNGRTYVYYNPDIASATVSGSAEIHFFVPMLGILGSAAPLQLNYQSVRAQRGTIDGASVVLYDLIDGDRTTRVFVDPQLDYRYRRIELRDKDVLIREITARDYVAFCATYYPTFHEDVTYNPDDAHSVATKETWRVLTAQFNSPIDPSAFEFLLDPASSVLDMRHMKMHQLQGARNKPVSVLDLLNQ